MIVPGRFYKTLKGQRMVFLSGPKGSGKTLAAVAIAEWLHEAEGYGVWSNTPMRFAEEPRPELPVHKVIVLDECRHFVDARDWQNVDLYVFDYLRHIDCYMLLSGVGSIDIRARGFQMERRLYPLVGDMVWLYVCWT